MGIATWIGAPACAWGLAFGLTGPVAHAADPLPVEAYGKLPFMRDARMSPDGTMVAAIVPSSVGHSTLVIHHLNGTPPTVIPADQYEPDWFKWKNDHRLIAAVHRTARARSLEVLDVETRVVAVDTDGLHNVDIGRGRERRFTIKGHRQLEDELVDLQPGDPKHILMGFGGQSGLNIERVDVDTGTGDIVEYGKNYFGEWITDHTGRARIGAGITTTGTQQFTYLRPSGSDDWREINRQDANFGTPIRPISFSSDPNMFYAEAVSSAGTWGVLEYDATNGTPGRILVSYPDTDAEIVQRDREFVGYLTLADGSGIQKAVYLDPVWQHDVESINRALPDTLNLIADRTADGKRLLIFARGPREPGAYYILDRNKPKPTMDLLGDRYPDIYPDQVLPSKPISFRARDGLQIHGYMVLPKGPGAKPLPFVVLPHGGPAARDNGYFDYWAQFLASRGYGVLQPNFRGSTGYGAKFQQAGLQQWGLAIQNDVTDGTKWLVDQKLADPKRICVMGGGFGGYTALMGVATEPDLYRCAISLDGITDLPAYAFHRRFFGGHFIAIAQFDNGKLSETSPVNRVDQIKAPVLLAHSRLDSWIPVEQTEAMESALKRAGKPVSALYFDDDDGQIAVRSQDELGSYFDGNDSLISVGSNRIAFLKAVESFLKDNLGPGG